MRNYLLKLRVLLMVMLLSAASTVAVMAQGREVTGVVTSDFDNEPLPGVSVQVKGTTRGAISDLDGTFRINVQPGDRILVFSFIGFQTREVEIGNQTQFTIALEESIESLQEAVVIGYGTQDKKEITSSVASVGAEQFNRGNFTNPTQLLQGKVAGLSVTRPGGNPNAAPTVRLRGISSFGATQSPLIVLDGVIGASIDAVDPNDIESFDVLKDASAAAIYGTRGAAGVILITTKRGADRKGISSVMINTFGTVEQPTNLIPILSPEQFVERGGVDYGHRTDWRDEITQTAVNGTINASITGGFENTSFLASVNYRNNDGIIRGTNRETLNTRFNINHGAFNNRLRMNLSLSFNNTDARNVNEQAVRYATVFNPTAPIFERDYTPQESPADLEQRLFNANRDFGGYFQRPLFDFFNPVALINQQEFTNEQRAAIYSYRIEYDLSDKFTIATQFSQDRYTDLATQYYSRQDFNVGFGRVGQAGQNMFDRTTTILNGTIRFEDEIFDRMNFTFLLGGETQLFNERGLNASTTRFLFDLGPNNLGAGGLRFGPGTGMGSFANTSILNSAFARANFNYANTYFVSASVRAETYSGFGRENQTGYFPALSLGADFTQIFDMGPFSQFKPRASFGIVGQLPPSPTLALGIFGEGNRIPLDPTNPVNSVFVAPLRTASPNPQLRWETTEEFTVGLDYGLFNNRVTGQMDYYRRNISDLIFNVIVPIGTPSAVEPGGTYTASNIWANVASLSSAGFEFVATVNNVQLGGVSWTPSFNFTWYERTRISNLGGTDFNVGEIRQGVPGSPGQNDNPMIWNREGERIGDFYGPRFLGLTDGGRYQITALDEDGELDPSQFERLGSALPTGDFGFSNTFIYGNWDLNFLLRGSWGHLLYNSYRGFYENADGASNTWNSVLTSNTPVDPLVTSTPTFSDLYLERGDFIRLDNLQLGYNVPTRAANLTNLRLYAGVQNLFTITDFTGIDPEVRWADNEDPANPNVLAPGIERRNTYFLPRIWQVGLNITFR